MRYMEKLKEYKGIIIIVLVLILGTFYWYSYRPTHITKLCITFAIDKAKEIEGDQTDARYFFWKCQKQYGLTD